MENVKRVVAIGGTLRTGSTTEAALRCIARSLEHMGAKVSFFAGPQLDLPLYGPGRASQLPVIVSMLSALRNADALIIASPGYHGGISGMIKNALDFTEEMAGDPSPYLSGRAVGCVASGAGWQGSNSTLQALRSVVHALRGWPTPLGIAFNSSTPCFDCNGHCISPQLDAQFEVMAEQVLHFCESKP